MTDSFLMLYPEVLAVLCVQVILSYIIDTFSNGCISFSVNEFGDSFVRRMMDALVSKIFLLCRTPSTKPNTETLFGGGLLQIINKIIFRTIWYGVSG